MILGFRRVPGVGLMVNLRLRKCNGKGFGQRRGKAGLIGLHQPGAFFGPISAPLVTVASGIMRLYKNSIGWPKPQL